jgi:hypothetical protein
MRQVGAMRQAETAPCRIARVARDVQRRNSSDPSTPRDFHHPLIHSHCNVDDDNF